MNGLLRRLAPTTDRVDLRIVCCPHAGGTARFFRDWLPGLPPTVELWAVQYPGHDDRLGEDCATDLRALGHEVADAVAPLLDRPVLLFGHSMGSIVAYEAARRIDQRTPRARVTLVVSSALAPGEWRASFDPRDDDALVAQLQRLGGPAAEVFDDPELRELLLPPVRADYLALSAYCHEPEPRLRKPIRAVTGNADPVADATAMARWRECTTGRFTQSTFPGGHFYLLPERAALLTELTAPGPPAAG